MSSAILKAAAKTLLPLLLLFSVFLLLRGHNQPGGGFIGGLVGASAFVLYALALDVPAARELLGVDPRTLIGGGLLLAISSGVIGLVTGRAFLSHRDFWLEVNLPGYGAIGLGTPLLFDLGVFLVVLGVPLTIILPLAEEQ